MAKSTVGVRFTGDTKDLRRAVRGVTEDLDDTRTAGKRVADAMSDMADEMERELRDTARAADKLAEALGPDFAATVSRGDLEQTVIELRKAGLTMEDIEADAEDLARAIKRIDDVSTGAGRGVARSFDDVGDSVRRTSGDVDKTRSVVANFAGNAAQDLPGVAGSFGALNVAVGQFAEYASEGDIALKRLAASAGPLLALTFVISKISADMQKTAEAKAFNKEQVQEWADAMREGATLAEAIAKSAQDVGKFEINGDDLTPALAAANLTVQDFTSLLGKSDEELTAWGESMRAAGADGDALYFILQAVITAQKNGTDATDLAAQKMSVFGRSEREAAEDTEELNQRLEQQTQRYEELLDATLAAFDANLGYRQSVDGLEDSFANLAETQKEHGTDSEEYRDALLDVEGAMLDQAASAVRLREDHAAANGVVLSAKEKQAIFRGELEKVAGTLAPGSPLRKQIQGYIASLDAVPETVRTKLLADTKGAFQSVQEFLNFLRASGVKGVGTTHSGLLASKQRQLLEGRASGGPVHAGRTYVVGEEGPELLHMGSSGSITPNDALGGGSTTYRIEVNVAPTADIASVGQSIVEAIAAYERRSGRRWRAA